MTFREVGTPDGTESLAALFALLKNLAIDNRRAIMENRRYFAELIGKFEARLHALEKSATDDRQVLLHGFALLEDFRQQWSALPLADTACHIGKEPEAFEIQDAADAILNAIPQLVGTPFPDDALAGARPPDGPRAIHSHHEIAKLRRIDRDILRAASRNEALLGKELAMRTRRYKFGPYFRSRLSFLCKCNFLRKNGEGYLLAEPDTCPATSRVHVSS